MVVAMIVMIVMSWWWWQVRIRDIKDERVTVTVRVRYEMIRLRLGKYGNVLIMCGEEWTWLGLGTWELGSLGGKGFLPPPQPSGR